MSGSGNRPVLKWNGKKYECAYVCVLCRACLSIFGETLSWLIYSIVNSRLIRCTINRKSMEFLLSFFLIFLPSEDDYLHFLSLWRPIIFVLFCFAFLLSHSVHAFSTFLRVRRTVELCYLSLGQLFCLSSSNWRLPTWEERTLAFLI